MQSILDMYNTEGTKVAYSLDTLNKNKAENKTYFEKWNFGTQLDNGESYAEPLGAFYQIDGLTVDAYFNGIKNLYNESTWPIH